MTLILIAAVARNRVIGRAGGVPWDLPEDRRHFRERTMGWPVLMGRRTFATLEGPLDGRRNVVLSRGTVADAESYRSLDAALDALQDARQVFVIGGAEVYRQTLPLAHRLVLSHIPLEPEGDAYFPPYEHLLGTEFRETERTARQGFEIAEYLRM